MAYNDNAVFIPGKGAVLVGEVGADRPTWDAVKAWVDAGAAGDLAGYHPLGHTSIDDLPSFDSDTEGGEVKGSWENSALRTTRTTVTESVTVQPIQWTPEPIRHRFGPGTVVNADGAYEVPAVYTSTEVSLLLIVIDGTSPLAFHIGKTSTSPDDSLDFDSENFLAMPIKYTILSAQGQPKFSILAENLKTDPEGAGTTPALPGGGE